jgi:hypothetical protein
MKKKTFNQIKNIKNIKKRDKYIEASYRGEINLNTRKVKNKKVYTRKIKHKKSDYYSVIKL